VGWCSGTDVFDPVAEAILNHNHLTADEKVALLVVLINALWNKDWDCQDESEHWQHPLVQRAMREVGYITDDE